MIRRFLQFLAGALLVIITYVNLFDFTVASLLNVRPRKNDWLVVMEDRMAGVREKLIQMGYPTGMITFVTTRDIKGGSVIPEDDYKWGQAQYVMLPWILVRNRRTLEGPEIPKADFKFVLGDFSGDEPLPELPAHYLKLWDTGKGVVLFKNESIQ